MAILTSQQAYMAMYAFLEAEYELSKSDEIGALLGALSLGNDGLPADPAVKGQWERAVLAAASGNVEGG